MNINAVTLSGKLGADPQVRESKGVRYGTFSLAVDEPYKHEGGWAYRPMWFRVVAFGNAANSLHRLSKGDWVVVAGALHLSVQILESEKKVYRVEIHARTIDSPPKKNGRPADGAPIAEPEAAFEEPDLTAESGPDDEAA